MGRNPGLKQHRKVVSWVCRGNHLSVLRWQRCRKVILGRFLSKNLGWGEGTCSGMRAGGGRGSEGLVVGRG